MKTEPSIYILKGIITYKQSQFYCDSCKKMKRGTGYLIPSAKKAFCSSHYQEAIKKELKK